MGLVFAAIGFLKFTALASSIRYLREKVAIDLPGKLTNKKNDMKLGAFSVSLNVKDILASKTFYESLGFKVFAGDIQKNYLIMKKENSLIGLFHGMFDKNILTF